MVNLMIIIIIMGTANIILSYAWFVLCECELSFNLLDFCTFFFAVRLDANNTNSNSEWI